VILDLNTSTSCKSTSLGRSTEFSLLSTRLRYSLINMSDGDNCTIINDELTCHSLINSNRHDAAELCLIPVGNRRNIEQDVHSDHLTSVEYASTLAACLDNDNYLIVTDDTSTSCQSSTMNVSASEQASKPSKSADNISEDYLIIIGESSSNFSAQCR
jgi:hypothetical protein